MNWGVRIFIAFVIFGIIMGVMVTISFNQEINLVATDYYRQEIEYDTQIEKLRNSAALNERPELIYDAHKQVLSLEFPQSLTGEFEKGEIHFFRPSDYKMDRKVKVELNEDGLQLFDMSQLQKGLWQAKFTWNSGTKAYYEEVKIII